jgi:hypothetical protein
MQQIQSTSDNPELLEEENWRIHNTRREAEDAAALAFGRLHPERKRQILETVNKLSRTTKPKHLQRKVVKVKRYSLGSSDLAVLLKRARETPEDTHLHGLIADSLDETHPGNKIAEMIRKQFGQGQYGGQGETNNLWHDAFYAGYENTHPYFMNIDRHGPFNLYLGHEGQASDRFEPQAGANQRWILRAVSRLPGSRDAAYNFEIPHEKAHELPRLFPRISRHISPDSSMKVTSNNDPSRQDEVNNFNDAVDEQERNRD